MSGGSLNYIYREVESAVREINSCSRNPLHAAFAKHLTLVAKALHDLEWVFSDDYSSPDEEEAIRLVIHPAAEIESAKEDAKIALKNLENAINNA